MWLFRDISCKYLVRKLSIDIFDIQLNSMQQSSVDTFTFDLVTKESDLYLQKFDLVNIKSYTSQTHYYKPLSWGLHSGLNRDNTNNNLKFNNEFEIGKTLNINDQFNFNTMLALGFDNSDIYIKPNLLLQTQLISSLKIGFTSFYKMYNENNNYYCHNLFITFKQDNFIYQIKYQINNKQNHNNILLNVKYNF